MKLDEKGRCPQCHIKPLSYKRNRFWFCMRCDRTFDMDSGEQIASWAWAIPPGGTEPTFRVYPFYILNNEPQYAGSDR